MVMGSKGREKKGSAGEDKTNLGSHILQVSSPGGLWVDCSF